MRVLHCTVALLVLLSVAHVALAATAQRRAARGVPNVGAWPDKDGVSKLDQPRPTKLMPDANQNPNMPDTKVFVLADGCLSSTEQWACSGNGRCQSAIASFFGVNNKQMEAQKRCYCYRGWFGLGCQLKLSDYGLAQKLKLVQAGMLTQIPGTFSFQAAYSSTIQDNFFAKRYKQQFPDAPHTGENTQVGSIPDTDQPGPHTDLNLWSSPPIEVTMAGAQMMTEFQSEQLRLGEILLRERTVKQTIVPTPPPLVKVYTNWKGKDLVVRNDEKHMGEVVTASSPEDVREAAKHALGQNQRLLATLDEMAGKTDQYGAPLAIPDKKKEITLASS